MLQLIGLFVGSIPTHVGKPCLGPLRRNRRRVYPHSRGETFMEQGADETQTGLSPLTWGNHSAIQYGVNYQGSIPTHVGKPVPICFIGSMLKVYPHSRGETTENAAIVRKWWGLSPLTWGNLSSSVVRRASAGSIPTHVGKPLRDNLLNKL